MRAAAIASGLVAVSAVASAQPDAGHDLTIGAWHLPPVVESATTLTVELELVNDGAVAWAPERGFAVAYHWFDDRGEVVVWDGERSRLPGPVEPGGRIVLDATLRTPARPGDYLLGWDVVQEGVRWISEVDPTPTEPRPVRVEPSHAFSMLSAETPRVVLAGGGRQARLRLRNDGLLRWPDDGSVAVAYHWSSPAGETVRWEGRRTPLPHPVLPGETIALTAVVEAPAAAGRHLLVWDMVDEGRCWFAELDPSPEPGVVVLVLPELGLSPWLWCVGVLAVAIAVVGRPADLRLPFADLWWCVGALIVKQWWVVAGAGAPPTISGWWLGLVTAALVGLVLVAVPARLRPWLSWLVVAGVTLVLFADRLHERFFGDLVSVAAAGSVGQLPAIGASVLSLLEPDDVWFWADLVAALPMVWSLSGTGRRPSSRRRPVSILAIVALSAGVAGGVAIRDEAVVVRQVFHTTELARRVGVLNLHLVDLGRSTAGAFVGARVSDADYAELVDYFDRRRPLRAGAGPDFAVARGSNLVMLQVESLQSFVVGLEVGGREVTPFLNALAGDGLFFSNVTDQTEEGRSSDAELATQTSLLPPDRGAAAFAHAGNRFTGVAAILGERGYHTMSAVAYDGSFWNRQVTHRGYGFADRLFVEAFEPGEVIGWGLNDRDFLGQVAARLDALPEPWCAYLLTLSLHHPFDGFPEHHVQLEVGRWDGTPFGNFLHTMHFFDRALADFISELDRLGMLERTVIAIWGDHDAGFEWRPEIADAMGVPAEPAGWYMSQRVPLVIKVPGDRAPVRVDAVPAGHVDVAPTLLSLLGVDPAGYAFVGRNLVGSPGPGPVVGEYRCWRDATHLYLRRGPLLGDGECIELATMRRVDPDACAASFIAARRQAEVSELVLEHDLQHRLCSSLAGGPS